MAGSKLAISFPALWLGSSLGFRFPGPTLGRQVWKTDTLPPTGLMSLYAAWTAAPSALVGSPLWAWIAGRFVSSSCTSPLHSAMLTSRLSGDGRNTSSMSDTSSIWGWLSPSPRL
uniref:Putative secreted protein n=1 Tax=Ixodes ricinus TaxID=34613 RepID=A0A6B0UKT5_IXORI